MPAGQRVREVHEQSVFPPVAISCKTPFVSQAV